MKKLLCCLLVLGSMTAFSTERVACDVSESLMTENESLTLVPKVEISYPSGALDFESLNHNFSSKSLTIDIGKLKERELLVSARIDDDSNKKPVRILEFKVHQKINNKYTEISRTYYRLGYQVLGLRHESIQFSFILPGTKIMLEFDCSKY